MNHSEIADCVCGKEIAEYDLSLGPAVRIAFFRYSDLDQAIEMPGNTDCISFPDSTQDLITRQLK